MLSYLLIIGMVLPSLYLLIGLGCWAYWRHWVSLDHPLSVTFEELEPKDRPAEWFIFALCLTMWAVLLILHWEDEHVDS